MSQSTCPNCGSIKYTSECGCEDLDFPDLTDWEERAIKYSEDIWINQREE